MYTNVLMIYQAVEVKSQCCRFQWWQMVNGFMDMFYNSFWVIEAIDGCNRQDIGQGWSRPKQEEDKGLSIGSSNTVANERTMMVHVLNTSSTNTTVVATSWLSLLTPLAEIACCSTFTWGQQSLDLLALLQHSSNWYLPKNKGKGTSVRRRMPRWGPKTGDRCTQHHKLWSTEWYLAQRVPWRSSRVDELWDETPPPWSYLKNLAEHPFHTLKLCSPPSHSTLCISQHQHSHALPWARKKRWLLVLKQSKLPW